LENFEHVETKSQFDFPSKDSTPVNGTAREKWKYESKRQQYNKQSSSKECKVGLQQKMSKETTKNKRWTKKKRTYLCKSDDKLFKMLLDCKERFLKTQSKTNKKKPQCECWLWNVEHDNGWWCIKAQNAKQHKQKIINCPKQQQMFCEMSKK
jgi:hypothetical protein